MPAAIGPQKQTWPLAEAQAQISWPQGTDCAGLSHEPAVPHSSTSLHNAQTALLLLLFHLFTTYLLIVVFTPVPEDRPVGSGCLPPKSHISQAGLELTR